MPPEPSVEEMRIRRREELLIRLAYLNAECEKLSARITEFLFHHKGLDGRYRASSLEELGGCPDRELSMRQAAWILDQERAEILSELATLTANEKETKHIAGVLTND